MQKNTQDSHLPQVSFISTIMEINYGSNESDPIDSTLIYTSDILHLHINED